jgi:hypothetical protein
MSLQRAVPRGPCTFHPRSLGSIKPSKKMLQPHSVWLVLRNAPESQGPAYATISDQSPEFRHRLIVLSRKCETVGNAQALEAKERFRPSSRQHSYYGYCSANESPLSRKTTSQPNPTYPGTHLKQEDANPADVQNGIGWVLWVRRVKNLVQCGK